MAAAFTVTLPPTVVSDKSAIKREIWLKSTSPFVVGQISEIALEKVSDNYPNCEDPLASKLSFAVAIGEESAEAPPYRPQGVLFPATSIRLDTQTGRLFLWAGTGAKAVKGSAYSVSFTEGSEVASSLTAGDHIYLRITVGVEADPESSDLALSPGIKRATPLILGSTARSSASSGVSSGLLGPGKNDVPKDISNQNSERRQVLVGRHPVGGGVGRFLGKFGVFPNITQHWAVFVGGYYHELGADEDLNNVYQNGMVGDEEFALEDVGYTTFNDQAIVDAGGIAIKQMDPKYRLMDNNCQKFSIYLLDQICLIGRKRLDTSYGPSKSVAQPEFKFNEETKEFEVVDRPVPIVKDEPPVTTVSTQLYYEPFMLAGSRFTDEDVLLTEEERKILLGRAAEIMGGTA